MSGTPNQISYHEVRIPRCMSLPPLSLLPMLQLPRLPKVDDEVLIPNFSHRAALVLSDGDAKVSLSPPSVSCLSPSPSYFSPTT